MKHAYSPTTGEIIVTDSPAEWMGTTAVTPPKYDPQTESCFWVDGGWIVKSPEAKTTEEPDPKMIGIEFNGVMCSATGADQNGLMAVQMKRMLLGSKFTPTKFQFSNGSTLVISNDNINAFTSIWMPFRDSFFSTDPA